MNIKKDDNNQDQTEWDMATSAIRTGHLLRATGSVLSALAVMCGVILAGLYLAVMKGDYAAVGVVASLIGIVPTFALGQFISLYGTRGVLHGIQVQNTILDLDTEG